MEKRFDNLKNILIVRLGAMGDIIHVMPAVINLRRTFPDASLVWLVEDKAQCLVEALPGIDEVIVFPRKKWQTALRHPRKYFTVAAELRAFLRKLREREYDVALDFHGNFRSGLLAYLSNAKTRVGFSKGYCKEANYIFTNVRMKPHQKKMHRIEKYFSLLQAWVSRYTTKGRNFRFQITTVVLSMILFPGIIFRKNLLQSFIREPACLVNSSAGRLKTTPCLRTD